MPINFTASTITYIQNGQAISAAVLNAPSVDLFDRTEEIKRASEQSKFEADHFTENSATVVALPTANSSAATVQVTSRQLEDSSIDTTPWKSYKFELNNSVISVRSKLVPGANYRVSSTDINSFFNDAAGSDFMLKEFHLPGETLCLKVPVTTSGFDEEVPNVTDQRLDDIENFSDYLSEGLPEGVELVKLSTYSTIEFNLLSKTPAQIVAISNSYYTDLGLTLGGDGSLSDGGTYSLYFNLDGGLYYKVTKLVTSGNSVIAHLGSSLTFPRKEFEINTSIPENYGFYILKNLNLDNALTEAQTVSFNQEINNTNFTITVNPDRLDSQYNYIPIASLRDYSIVIGDMEVPLRATVGSSVNATSSWNTVGAPREPILPGGDTTKTGIYLVGITPVPAYSGARCCRVSMPFKYSTTAKALVTDSFFDLPELKAAIFSSGVDATITDFSFILSCINIEYVSVSALGSPSKVKITLALPSEYHVFVPGSFIEFAYDPIEFVRYDQTSKTVVNLLKHYGTDTTKISSTFKIKGADSSNNEIDLMSYTGILPIVTFDITIRPA
jgi:hypothetical protein